MEGGTDMPSNHNSKSDYKKEVLELCAVRKFNAFPCRSCIYFQTRFCPDKEKAPTPSGDGAGAGKMPLIKKPT